MSPQEYYSQQVSIITARHTAANRIAARLSWFRILLALLILAVFILSVQQKESWQWLLTAVLVIGFFYLLRIHSIYKDRTERYRIHLELLNGEIKALNGDYSSFPAGSEYIDPSHPYSFDLDIFGKGSIYQMLCRTVTRNGDCALADLLKHPYAGKEEIEERQNSIKELAGTPTFLEQFRVSGNLYAEDRQDMARVKTWLQAHDKFINKPYLFVLAAVVPLISIALIVLSFIKAEFQMGLLYVLIFNLLVLRIYHKDIHQTHLLVGRSVKLLDKYERLLLDISTCDFKSQTLAKIVSDAGLSLKQLAQFRKLAHLFDSRQNGMVGPLINSFFLFDIYCVLRLETWRKKNREVLDASFADITNMDVLVSLSTYAFNNPNASYVTIDTDCNKIIANDLQHPFLNASSAVGNHFTLGHNEHLYLLTGANMTGKSTFIRTVGVNLVMAYMGLPVRATSFQVPLLNLYTAIRITDSVQDDISYFKAELNRIQHLLHTVQHSDKANLILMDEPLKGTNSTDKQMGTQAIMEKLLQYNVLGIIATHDTGLCKLEGIHPGKISNYHFESEISGASLKFDYQLKPGCSTSNNATILMKLMNII
jgi:predicted ATPase/prepilin signal peptidase PulO-like enzyme (type II secretory pathway)